MRLGELISCWRLSNSYSLREAAKHMGLSHATLDRIENGEDMSGPNMIKLMMWIFGEAP